MFTNIWSKIDNVTLRQTTTLACNAKVLVLKHARLQLCVVGAFLLFCAKRNAAMGGVEMMRRRVEVRERVKPQPQSHEPQTASSCRPIAARRFVKSDEMRA